MLQTITIPAELSSRKRQGKVWVYDRDRRALAEGGFVIEPKVDRQKFNVPMTWTGASGLAVLWDVWVESWGRKGYAPIELAKRLDENVRNIHLRFDVHSR